MIPGNPGGTEVLLQPFAVSLGLYHCHRPGPRGLGWAVWSVRTCPCVSLHGSWRTVGPRLVVTWRQSSTHSLDRLQLHVAPCRSPHCKGPSGRSCEEAESQRCWNTGAKLADRGPICAPASGLQDRPPEPCS
uniref:Uncharacterized protein n=1 Tax=Molossus molossus TaxID=27622 RepID=A0A7J8ERT9_MOLMO|nr:hypothetical protein HJG59_008787 [Molossus molossus]